MERVRDLEATRTRRQSRKAFARPCPNLPVVVLHVTDPTWPRRTGPGTDSAHKRKTRSQRVANSAFSFFCCAGAQLHVDNSVHGADRGAGCLHGYACATPGARANSLRLLRSVVAVSSGGRARACSCLTSQEELVLRVTRSPTTRGAAARLAKLVVERRPAVVTPTCQRQHGLVFGGVAIGVD
jgi:hypothetical protein